jgi:hypothetical protein
VAALVRIEIPLESIMPHLILTAVEQRTALPIRRAAHGRALDG